MPKFRISYTTEDWWQLDVEAAIQEVYEILWDVAHDYTAPVVL